LYTVGRIPWTGDRSVARPLPTLGTTQTQNKRTQHPCLKWDSNHDPSVQAGEAVHALDKLAHLLTCWPTNRAFPGSADLTSRWSQKRFASVFRMDACAAFFLGFPFHPEEGGSLRTTRRRHKSPAPISATALQYFPRNEIMFLWTVFISWV
jgi:hypothetical protein